MKPVRVSVKGGPEIAGKAWATEDVSERTVGWLRKTETQAGDGLVIAPASAVHTLGMKVTIDVVFLDHEARVCKIKAHVAPGRFAFGAFKNMLMPWRSQVLELPAGAANTLKPGDILEMTERTL